MSEREAPKPSRRRFLRSIGSVGIGAALAGSSITLAATPVKKTSKKKTKAAAADTTNAEGEKPPGEEAVTLAGIIRIRYGSQLTPVQMEGITRELDNRVDNGRKLRAVLLANGLDPDTIFHA